jgi:nucleotidyltransferase/DNA polymerase involved in DNA repair
VGPCWPCVVRSEVSVADARQTERASIDEAFIDVTAEVDAWLEEHPPQPVHAYDDDDAGPGADGRRGHARAPRRGC